MTTRARFWATAGGYPPRFWLSITGAFRGIGAAVAERLADDGFSVLVNYAANEAEASAVADKIKAAGGRAITVKADVSNPAEVKKLFDVAEKEFGGVDVLVNNAGIMSNATIANTDGEPHQDLVSGRQHPRAPL